MKGIFYCLIFVFLNLITSRDLSSQILTAQSGNWTATSTWVGGVVPGSTDIVQLQNGHALNVNTNATVSEFRYNFGSSSPGGSTLSINGGNTLTTTGDFNFSAPSVSNKTANVNINGTLSIGGNMNFQFGGTLQNNLTVDINVNGSGSLSVTGNLVHNSSASSTFNTIDLNVSGTFSSADINFNFNGSDSEFISNISGNWTSGNLIADLRKADSKFTMNLLNGADVIIENYYVTSFQPRAEILLSLASGSKLNKGGTSSFMTLFNRGSNSKIDVILNDELRYNGWHIVSQSTLCSLNLVINTGGAVITGNTCRIRQLGSDGNLNIDVNQGGSIFSAYTIVIRGSTNGINNIDIDGGFTSSNNMSFNFASGSTTNLLFGPNSTLNCALYCSDLKFISAGNSTVNLTNNGSFTSLGSLTINAAAGDNITATFNQPATINGNYIQNTVGSNSRITTHVTNSLTLSELQQNISSGAINSDNVMNIDYTNSILSLNSIDAGFAGTLTAGSTNNSTVVYQGNSSGLLVSTASNVEYDNLTINNTSAGGIGMSGTLNSSNFFGDLTVNSGARFQLSGGANLRVQGNFINNGTFDAASNQRIAVSGNLTNTNLFNNNGGKIAVIGNFTNSGTFDNVTGSPTSFKVIGNYVNTGTFEAEFDSSIVNGNLTNNGTYTSKGDIFLEGDFANNLNYTYQSGDEVTFNGSSVQAITGIQTFYDMTVNNSAGVNINSGMTSIQNQLTISSGQLDTKGNMTFLSNSSGTAALGDLSGGGSITGNVTVQRYLNESASAFWYMMGAPVAGSTLADWNNEIYMSGFPGAGTSWGPTVYRYDINNISSGGDYSEGYIAPTNVTNGLAPGAGWMIWIDPSPITADVTGTLNTGNVVINVAHNTNPTGGATKQGWGLVSNPYASPISWPIGIPLNMESEAYVSKPDGNYWAVNGDNINAIYSGEGFWVQSKSGGGTLLFRESDKIVSADAYNSRKAEKPIFTDPLKLELTFAGDTSYMDYSVLQFGGDSNSVDYDHVYGEALKISNQYGVFPNIASYSAVDNADIYYNTLNPEDSNWTMPLYVWKLYAQNKNETYTIEFNGIENWANNNRCLILNDSLNNYSVKLDRANHDYSWTVYDTTKSKYLYLTYSIPLEVSYTNATCYGYNDGSAVIQGYDNTLHTYVWFDENENIIKREDNIKGKSSMNNLAAGTYVVMVSNNGDCGIMGATVVIEQPDPVIADFSSDVDTVWMNSNTTIYFTNSSVNADVYYWDFGDGNTSDLKSPSHTFIDGGDYIVKLVAMTDVCSDTLYKTIVVVANVGINDNINVDEENIQIYLINQETFVEFNFDIKHDATIRMHDLLGRSIIEPLRVKDVTNGRVKVHVPVNLSGVYAISVVTEDEKVVKKIYYSQK